MGGLAKNGGVQDFQTSFVTLQTITSGTVSGTNNDTFSPNPVHAESFVFAGADVAQFSPEQYQKLQWMFNMYEKVKLAGVQIEYIPRWSEQIGTTLTPDPTVPVSSNLMLRPSITPGKNDVWEMMMIHDDEDIIVRTTATPAGLLDEWFQVDLQDGAKKWMSNQRKTIYIRPAIVEAYDPTGSGQGGQINSADPGVPANSGAMSTPIDVLEAGNRPVTTPWLDTKVTGFAGQGGITPQINLNTYTNHFGIKLYAFNPYMVPFTTAPAPNDHIPADTNQLNVPINPSFIIGYFKYRYYWCFKDLDNRALILPAIPALNGLGMAALELQFDGMPQPRSKKPRYMNQLEKATEIQRGQVQDMVVAQRASTSSSSTGSKNYSSTSRGTR